MTNEELKQQCIDGARRNLRAAAAYRKRIWNVPGVNVYECEDKRFADAMWQGCMNNARSAIRNAMVLSRRGK